MRSALLVISLAAVARAQLSRPAITTLGNGAVRVVNAGPSLWSGTGGWTLQLERTIAPADGSPGMLGRPRQLGVDANGRVVVFDWGVNKLLVYDSTGRFLRELGRIGEGPQEYQVPLDIDVRGDTVGVYSPNSARSLVWRTDGTVLGQGTSAPCCAIDFPRLDGRGGLLVPQWVASNGVDRAAAVRWSFSGKILDTVMLPPPDPRIPGFRMGRGMAGRPFTPYRHGVFDSRSRYIHGFPTTYTLIFSRTGSDTARVVTLPGSRARVPESLRDSLYQRFASDKRITDRVTKDDIPSEQPLFGDLVVDELDDVWIGRLDGRGVVASYDVIDRDGRFLGAVAAPPGMVFPPVIRRGHFYRISENADGLPVIEVYRVVKTAR
jgi:hypothetical protein